MTTISHARVDKVRSALLILVALLGPLSTEAYAQGPTPWVGVDDAGVSCTAKSFRPWNDPMDYRNPKQGGSLFRKVVGAHFKPEMENLQKDNAIGDVAYTLNAIPNHHRALYAMMRYQHDYVNRQDAEKRRAFRFPPTECWMKRAINFAPTDERVRMLYAMDRHRKGDLEAAMDLYLAAKSLNPSDPEIAYNTGLLLCDMERFDEAVSYAESAYAAGFQLPGLKKRLQRAGYRLDGN